MLAFFKRLALALGLCVAALGLPVAPSLARAPHQTTPPAPIAMPSATPAHPALWKVQKGDSMIYLFGTVHALPPEVVWLDGPIARAFDTSDELVTEIIEKSPEEMAAIIAAKATLPAGQNLRAGLPPATRKALEKALAANGLPPAALDTYRPWYAAIEIALLPLIRAGYNPDQGVDTKLSLRAEAHGLRHGALETAEYQFGLLDSLPIGLQKAYLRDMAVEAPRITAEMIPMIEAWKSGDAKRLARLMNADESDPRLAETLLTGRNRQWAQWIKARLNRPGTVFLAVGAGHLAGKGSVQDQLKRLGIAATRVQ